MYSILSLQYYIIKRLLKYLSLTYCWNIYLIGKFISWGISCFFTLCKEEHHKVFPWGECGQTVSALPQIITPCSSVVLSISLRSVVCYLHETMSNLAPLIFKIVVSLMYTLVSWTKGAIVMSTNDCNYYPGMLLKS